MFCVSLIQPTAGWLKETFHLDLIFLDNLLKITNIRTDVPNKVKKINLAMIY
jgi:uncharacterized membrane protein (UPF0127 family)